MASTERWLVAYNGGQGVCPWSWKLLTGWTPLRGAKFANHSQKPQKVTGNLIETILATFLQLTTILGPPKK